MISSQSEGHPVEILAAEYVSRRRRGERPTIDDYVAKHPDLADAIRELFPTIGVLEDVREQQETPPAASTLERRKKLTRLGDFRIVREVGRGGMGIVYEAVQESLGRRVAVKVLATRAPLDETHRRRFLREARTAGRLHHTNIVPILGVGEQDGFDFYVMQFIDGTGLDAVLSRLRDADDLDLVIHRLSSFWQGRSGSPNGSRMENGPPAKSTSQAKPIEKRPAEATAEASPPQPQPSDSDAPIGGTQPLRHLCRTYWQDVALVGLQVAEALEYAHGQGILHRDIKPANLLLDGHGTTWVADFGLAKGIEQEAVSRTGEVLGTLLYMAPEQWRGTADARSDIYSLGVTLYELLTLRTPCQIQDRMKSLGPSGLHPAIVPPRKLSPSIPVDLETIVMRAIAEEPEHRYQSAGQLAADLGRFLEDRPISIRRPTLRERWSRWRRRNPAAAALSVLAACLTILVGVVLSIAYVQTRAGLARESDERRRAEKTLATSLQTLENVFRHLVPEQLGQAHALTITADGQNAGPATGTQPVVSPEAASLLEDLRHVYDQLASAEGTNVGLRMDAARATRRVGDIYGRLGNFDRAEAAYRQSLEKYQALRNEDATGHVQLELARLHNDLGAIYGRTPDLQKSQAEHQQALAMLQGNTSTPTGPDVRFELARTYFLLGRAPDHGSNPELPERSHQPPARPDRRRPGHRPPPRDADSPPARNGFPDPYDALSDRPRPKPGHPEELQRAIAVLDSLVKEDPKNPAYRYLLAQCYREQAGPDSGPLPPIDKAEELLQTLVKDYPQVADYRFELADTCAMLDVRELTPEDFPQAEQRLRAALEQSADLVDGHPYAPDYISLHVHVLHKLARILRDRPPERREADRARMDEAGQLYQEAIRRQAALVKRFPDNVGYRFWLAKIRMSSAEFLLERRQPAEARTSLETAVAETEKFSQAHLDATTLRPVLHELYAKLSQARHHLDDEQGAGEARRKAEQFGPPLPDHPEDNGPPDHRRGPPPHRRGPGPGGPPPESDE
jgi:eukaryotic-like serine/threonine-protein kinase